MKNPATREPSPTRPNSDNGDEFDARHAIAAFESVDLPASDDSGAHEDIKGCEGVAFGETCENAIGTKNRASNNARTTFMRFSENGKTFSSEPPVLLYGENYVVSIPILPE